jgi:diguanylate cyclase (GGDEF)-like protein/PAS domain S-box-containing protein
VPPTPDPGQPPVDRFEQLAEVLASGILTADASGAVRYANPAARELLWSPTEDLYGDGWLEALDPSSRTDARAAAERVLQRGTTEVVDLRVTVDIVERWVRARFNAISEVSDRAGGWVAVFDDITLDRATADELSMQATHDPLTGLPNRTLLEDRLAQAVARSRRNPAAVTVFFLDLDRFKEVNDLHGHHVGDQLLQEVARRINQVVRAEDTAARLGGDEFVVIAEGLGREGASSVAERILDAIGAPIDIDGVELILSTSIGVALSERGERSPAQLIEAADAAMYDAKRSSMGVAFASSDP